MAYPVCLFFVVVLPFANKGKRKSGENGEGLGKLSRDVTRGGHRGAVPDYKLLCDSEFVTGQADYSPSREHLLSSDGDEF